MISESNVDRSYFKQICLVLYRVYKDTADNNKLNFEYLESYVGSLDKMLKIS